MKGPASKDTRPAESQHPAPGVWVCRGWTCASVRAYQDANPNVDLVKEAIFCWGCKECCPDG